MMHLVAEIQDMMLDHGCAFMNMENTNVWPQVDLRTGFINPVFMG